jgi:hypothetical protein
MDNRFDRSFALSKYERNDLYHAIELTRVPVTDFQLSTHDRESGQVTAIRHLSSGSVFRIKKDGMGKCQIKEYICPTTEVDPFPESRNRKAASRNRLVVSQARVPSVTWNNVPGRIKSWIEKILQYVEEVEIYQNTPDLWDELERSREFLSGYEQHFENTPFTANEQTQVSAQIQQIEAYIKATYRLTSEQISRVEATFKQAEQASHHMGRKDWLMLFNGAVFSLILTDLITPDTAQHIILTAIHGLSQLFGIGGPPPHLPPGG